MFTPQIDMLARVIVSERTARLAEIDRQRWMQEDGESDFEKTPFRPTGLILAILAVALFVAGRMILI